MRPEISCEDLSALLKASDSKPTLLLDVRESWEWELAHISGSIHIPMHLIPLRHNELPDDTRLIIICHHGVRSLQVAHYLLDVGFEQVYSLNGGIDRWATTVDSSIPLY